MFERPIVIYSDYCSFSQTFMNTLLKHAELFEVFIRLNIDVNPQTRQRPHVFYELQKQLNYKIKEVPTIVVDNGLYVLTGVEAFKWLEHEINLKQKSNIEAFYPNEMGSFSDSYARYGSTKLHDATEQTFKFISKPEEKIYTPQEDDVQGKGDMTLKQKERDDFSFSCQNRPRQKNVTFNLPNVEDKLSREKDLSRLINDRNQFNPTNRPTNTSIDFTGNFGFAQEMSNSQRFSRKEKEIDVKLQQLLSDRETFQPSNKIDASKVDFATGRILQ